MFNKSELPYKLSQCLETLGILLSNHNSARAQKRIYRQSAKILGAVEFYYQIMKMFIHESPFTAKINNYYSNLELISNIAKQNFKKFKEMKKGKKKKTKKL